MRGAHPGAGGRRPAVAAAFPGRNGLIAFAGDRDGDVEIFTTKPGGSQVTQLTFNDV